MGKQRVVVLFGGQSSEHEVSCLSAQTIIKNIDTDENDILMVGITKGGKWILVDELADIKNNTWREKGYEVVISPNAEKKELIILKDETYKTQKIDVVFPVLHGLYGEDGTVQGLLELSKIPYVGCGVLSSAVSMDKLYTKIIVDDLGVKQAEYVGIRRDELKDMDKVIQRVEAKFSYPVFVKPSRAGSSCGVSRADNGKELIDSLRLAADHDRKILVEEAIKGREIECAVLGGEEVVASGIGEILAAADHAFYDYDAKYNSEESKTVINPEMPKEVVEKIQQASRDIFMAVDGFGLSRVDFFVENGSNEVVFNEINTLPGFTSISMYPMLFEAAGIDKKELVRKLIQLAVERQEA
ncbi:D-alanine-D-alanine ligase [Aequitasia blattaphilus]|uniref:D-alanine--D-alanine ligase n=1 Tax=Aequitasia blattaphilus TaxID=2949332 RepID=A0ABT1E599_9FIRM|nr:D-alanine--D-alanine ligase family protein [Aequitasia blattaphilus]MCP1100923.1 D-alanine--D-alanine ligase [Aequitasia blattaphilus]MCR8613563.1 D-alanine--D-alanine ligase [Aequitasia blattaphilus]